MPDVLKTYILSAPTLKERRQRIIAVVTILREYSLDIAVKAAEQAVSDGRTDVNGLRILAALFASTSGGGAEPTGGTMDSLRGSSVATRFVDLRSVGGGSPW
ncbi:MAG: hypothetical protein ACOX20_06315 [Limnochordia bacterium]